MKNTVNFSVTLSPDWRQLDLHPDTRNSAARDIVRDFIKAVPELEPRQSELTAYIRNISDKAWRIGTRFCSICAIPVDDTLLVASLSATLLPRMCHSDTMNPLDWISDNLPVPKDSLPDDWFQIVPAELSDGHKGVRRFGIMSQEVEPHTPLIPAVIMETYIPRPEGTLMITATSPATDLADELFELFDVVTARFEIR